MARNMMSERDEKSIRRLVSNPKTSENNYFYFMIKCITYKLFSVL